MASRTFHFPGFSIVQGDIRVDLNMDRFSRQFQDAQTELDANVMNSMKPFMPHYNGTFIQQTQAASDAIRGSGMVYAAYTPGGFGRYLYEGKVMVDAQTGKGPRKIPMGPGGDYILRFRKGARLVATERPLDYTKTHNPNVTDHWFDAAKKKDGRKWIEAVKRTAGGG